MNRQCAPLRELPSRFCAVAGPLRQRRGRVTHQATPGAIEHRRHIRGYRPNCHHAVLPAIGSREHPPSGPRAHAGPAARTVTPAPGTPAPGTSRTGACSRATRTARATWATRATARTGTPAASAAVPAAVPAAPPGCWGRCAQGLPDFRHPRARLGEGGARPGGLTSLTSVSCCRPGRLAGPLSDPVGRAGTTNRVGVCPPRRAGSSAWVPARPGTAAGSDAGARRRHRVVDVPR